MPIDLAQQPCCDLIVEYHEEFYLLRATATNPFSGGKYVRLDGYLPPGSWAEFPEGAILSRKNTQYLERADPIAAGRRDLDELRRKYESGMEVVPVPSSGNIGGDLIEGTPVLEIPVQLTDSLPPEMIAHAEAFGIVIRDEAGKLYTAVR